MNNFLPALFAFFFWGRSTADTEDRTRHRSWMRTFAYFILTLSVGFIYLKTLEVPMMMNYVDVRAAAYTVRNDTIGESVRLIFNNVMDDDAQAKHAEDQLVSALKFHPNGVSELDTGSLCLKFTYPNDTSYRRVQRYKFMYDINYKNRVYYKDEKTNDMIAVASSESFANTYDVDSLSTLVDGQYDYGYLCIFTRKIMRTMTPLIVPKKQQARRNRSDSVSSERHRYFFYPTSQVLRKWLKVSPDSILHGYGNISFIGMNQTYDNDNVVKETFQIPASQTNHLGFFTAADISQSNFQLLIHSDAPIKEVRVAFNTPVEIQHLPFKVDELSPYGFSITSPELIDQIKDRDVRFFLKFPAMANKQLVRSLILTTLLTALASLFLSNLYFCVRWFIHRREYDDEEPLTGRTKRARCIHQAMMILILLAVLLFAVSVFLDWTIILPYAFMFWGWVIAIALIIAFLGIEYALYRYIQKDPSRGDQILY